MSPEDQKYYDIYEDLFASDGWKQFIEDIEKLTDIEKDKIWRYSDSENQLITTGQVRALSSILYFQTTIENNYKQLEEEETFDASL